MVRDADGMTDADGPVVAPAGSPRRFDIPLGIVTKVADAYRPGGPFKEGAFTSRTHDRRAAAWLGMALGVTFGICFATGLLSSLIQSPPSWFVWTPRPAGLYRWTQGLHVWTGLAAIPLLLIKLFVVYPSFWQWPPIRTLAEVIERLMLALLVGGGIFLLLTGVQNIAYWYPWGFFFPTGHLWAAWITIGAMVIHIGAKHPIVAQVWRDRRADRVPLVDLADGGLTRRGLVATAGLASAVLVVLNAGSTVPLLRGVSILAPRDPEVGPQGFPVNKTAAGVGVADMAQSSDWRLLVDGAVGTPLSLTRADLLAMPQHTAELPIACVEGWSTSQVWTGVILRDLLDRAGAAEVAAARLESLQATNVLYSGATLAPNFTADPDTMIVLKVNGEDLHLDHGYPARLMAPNNPGVLQTKWLSRVVVL